MNNKNRLNSMFFYKRRRVMKYFIVSMTLVATVLSAEVAVAQTAVAVNPGMISGGGVAITPAPAPSPVPVPVPVQTLTTPGGHMVNLPSQANVPFNVVPANPHAFGGMIAK
jgi:hypothetical protein